MKNVPILAIGFAVAAVFAASPPDNYLTLAEWKKALSENDGYLRVLQVQNRNVLESAKALVNKIGTNGTIDLVRANRHADEIVRSLAVSDNYLTRLEKATDIALDAMQLGYLADLHRHYRKAIAEQRLLKDELISSSPRTDVIVMKALAISAEVKKAEEGNIDITQKGD